MKKVKMCMRCGYKHELSSNEFVCINCSGSTFETIEVDENRNFTYEDDSEENYGLIYDEDSGEYKSPEGNVWSCK